MHPMDSRSHGYRVSLTWTGNTGAGTRDRRAYRRTHRSGNFTEVVLRPQVTIAKGSDAELAQRLHDAVDELCFIARSVNFPVRHQPTTAVAG
jgi:hypothetical protein